MGTYNTVHAGLTCPHCGHRTDHAIEVKSGNTANMDHFAIGDRYKWFSSRAPQNGGRPEDGSVDAVGYTECPACERDFFVKVQIVRDVIRAVTADTSKPGYIQE
jgi:hypothetical protein